MDPLILMEMWMSSRTVVEPERAPRRFKHRRAGGDRLRQSMAAAAAPAPPARPAVPPPDHSNNPLLQTAKPHAKLPFLDRQAKGSAYHDLRAKALARPTAHPTGPRHPRVYTLIGRGNLPRPSQRGTPSAPPPASLGVLTRKAPPRLLPAPAPASEAGPSRRERTQGRTDPYPSHRPNRGA
ncbi:hypothetical protein PTTG_25992 [Puccinia triticina 1-1 BBBD Race 1]|uniref:Uncharacterized protein n=1 Tax=Puccinia triticina (isolate 1-1 / race 1 (BBBD)) TaxID=630390 RepID=A0A180GXJ6_PUCT1|nr:hypothetical protein PTTG_25992 [Puccinia triticina 1-1 BBBD Race 1]